MRPINNALSKIKLQSLFHFRLGNPIIEVSNSLITSCHSTLKHLLLGCGKTLLIYKLPDLQLLCEKQVSKSSIIKIISKDEKIYLLNENSSNVYCYDFDFEGGKLNLFCTIEGHRGNINDFIINKQFLITGSQDYTLRVWQRKAPHKIIKVLSGHKCPIKILGTYKDSNVLSVSSDGQLKFWQGQIEISQKKFSYKITDIFVNSYTGELFVTSIDAPSIQIYGISNAVTTNFHSSQNKKIFRLKYKLNLNRNIMRKVHQLDESFIVAWNSTQLIFLEKNLNQIILEKQIKDIKHISNVDNLMILVTDKAVFIEDLQF